MLPTISVIVPTQDRPDLLKDCVGSLREQAYPRDRYEVVVVDDGVGSRLEGAFDDSGRGPKISVVRSPGGGLNAARNAGLGVATGELLVFVDDDVIAPAGWLQALADGSQRYPDAGCFAGPLRLRIEGDPPRFCGRPEPIGTVLELGPQARPVDVVYGANMTIRRSAVAQVGPFDEALSGPGDETEWQQRYRSQQGEVMYLPEAWVVHRRVFEAFSWRVELRARFRAGVKYARNSRRFGRKLKPGTELLRACRGVGHALKERCAFGLMAAGTNLGRIWGWARPGNARR